MASINRHVRTYHVVPRFDIAAHGGPLALGTIMSDLRSLRPLNRGPYHVKVPDQLLYAPVEQADFRDTLERVRERNIGAWARALGLPVGASADIGDAEDIEELLESFLWDYPPCDETKRVYEHSSWSAHE